MQHAIVHAPAIPLYQQGMHGSRRPVVRRMSHTVRTSHVPVFMQGWTLGAGAAQAAVSAVAAGAASGGVVGPVGAAIGAVVGLIGGLFAAHALRARQAKNENQAVSIAVSGFDSDLQKIQQAFKAGQLSASDAQQAVQVALQGYWTVTVPQIQPGRNGCQNGSACYVYNPAVNNCKGNIGAACCIGCSNLVPSITGANGVMAAIAGQSGSPKGLYVAEISQIGPSKYGFSGRQAYSLDFTPPASAGASLTRAFSSAGGGGGVLPLLALGVVAWMALS